MELFLGGLGESAPELRALERDAVLEESERLPELFGGRVLLAGESIERVDERPGTKGTTAGPGISRGISFSRARRHAPRS